LEVSHGGEEVVLHSGVFPSDEDMLVAVDVVLVKDTAGKSWRRSVVEGRELEEGYRRDR
jgi:hypothetical protein